MSTKENMMEIQVTGSFKTYLNVDVTKGSPRSPFNVSRLSKSFTSSSEGSSFFNMNNILVKASLLDASSSGSIS